MTVETRRRLESLIVALLMGAGGGWSVIEFRLGSLEEQVREIDMRVQAIYCATVPEEVRAGCR